MATALSYRSQPSQTHPHIEWLELRMDNVLHECAVLRRDAQGSVYYIELNALDQIDKRRLVGILADRNAKNFELWDLLSQKTLGNGVNALVYFHQLVHVLTPSGKILDQRAGQVGIAAVTGQITLPGKAPVEQPAA